MTPQTEERIGAPERFTILMFWFFLLLFGGMIVIDLIWGLWG